MLLATGCASTLAPAQGGGAGSKSCITAPHHHDSASSIIARQRLPSSHVNIPHHAPQHPQSSSRINESSDADQAPARARSAGRGRGRSRRGTSLQRPAPTQHPTLSEADAQGADLEVQSMQRNECRWKGQGRWMQQDGDSKLRPRRCAGSTLRTAPRALIARARIASYCRV
eukprot:3128267-Rhodomonas_salina.1